MKAELILSQIVGLFVVQLLLNACIILRLLCSVHKLVQKIEQVFHAQNKS